MAFSPGDAVQTPFGKGVVREVRNHGRLLVEVAGRSLALDAADVTALPQASGRAAKHARERHAPRAATPSAAIEIDLHGLTVEEALARAERALDEALLADAAELRLIHGRSGGRIRDALHRWLARMPAARHYRLDPGNPGVTIVAL